MWFWVSLETLFVYDATQTMLTHFSIVCQYTNPCDIDHHITRFLASTYRPISQIRLGLFLRLKSDLIFSGASSVWSYFGPYAILTSAGSYIQNTTNAGLSVGFVRWLYCIHSKPNSSHQLKFSARTNRRPDCTGNFRHRHRPQLREDIHVASGYYWWCLHNQTSTW